MRNGLSIAYSGLGWLIVALGVLQFFLVGLGFFGGEGFSAHKDVGWGLHSLTVLVVLLAILGPRTRRDIVLAVALLVVTTVQTALPGLRDDAGWLAAFHPVLALAVLGLAAEIGRRYIGAGPAGGSGEPAAA